MLIGIDVSCRMWYMCSVVGYLYVSFYGFITSAGGKRPDVSAIDYSVIMYNVVYVHHVNALRIRCFAF